MEKIDPLDDHTVRITGMRTMELPYSHRDTL